MSIFCVACHGTGAVDTPTSEAEPTCYECDGEGYIATPVDSVVRCRACDQPANSKHFHCPYCNSGSRSD